MIMVATMGLDSADLYSVQALRAPYLQRYGTIGLRSNTRALVLRGFLRVRQQGPCFSSAHSLFVP